MPAKPSAVINTRVIHCGEQRDVASIFGHLHKLPDERADLIYIDRPFKSNLADTTAASPMIFAVGTYAADSVRDRSKMFVRLSRF